MEDIFRPWPKLYERERESPRLQSWDESDPTKNFNNQAGYIQSEGV